MEDLVHQFLLKSGYPRASIVSDVHTFMQKIDGSLPAFVVVDPETATPLAIVGVLGAVDLAGLTQEALKSDQYIAHLGGSSVQSFLVRVDFNGSNKAEQVQFYRVLPNAQLQQMTARSFPDLDSLKVVQKIYLNSHHLKAETESEHTPVGSELSAKSERVYWPAIALAIIAALDWVFGKVMDMPLLSVSHSILLIGAAVLFLLPTLMKERRF